MNKEQTTALWKQGREAWNRWAHSFSPEGQEKAEDGTSTLDLKDDSQANEDPAKADFSGMVFEDHADFSGFIFPGDVFFTDALFHKGACFDKAEFQAEASFQRVDFRGIVTFAAAIFRQVPDFRFCGFLHVPPFGRTHFPKADILNLAYSRQVDATARYQALKALAHRAGHYQHIADFTAREMVARRHILDQWWHPRFWLGLFYQVGSDFGRSIVRPFLFWLASIPLYAFVYLTYYRERSKPLVPDDMTDLSGWWHTMRNWTAFGKDISVSGLECEVDQGSLLAKSLYLSFKSALLNIGGASDSKLKQVYACLYGENKKLGGGELMPVIPDPVAFLVLSQMTFSIVFLLLMIVGFVYQFHKR